MENFIMDMFGRFLTFRCNVIDWLVMTKEEYVVTLYSAILKRRDTSKGIMVTIWNVIFWIVALANFVAIIPLVVPAIIVLDIPYIIFETIIWLNHWDL